MKNQYEICGDITKIFLIRPDGTKLTTIIDTVDLPFVQKYPGLWYARWDRKANSYYVCGHYRKSDGTKAILSLNRVIMRCPPNFIVDHKDHDTLNNRRSTNLRIVTRSGNMQNRLKANSTSKTQVLNVRFNKITKKWVVVVTVNGKERYFGQFDYKSDAENRAKVVRAKYLPFSQEALNSKKKAINQ